MINSPSKLFGKEFFLEAAHPTAAVLQQQKKSRGLAGHRPFVVRQGGFPDAVAIGAEEVMGPGALICYNGLKFHTSCFSNRGAV